MAAKARKGRTDDARYRLVIPLDATQIDDVSPNERVKVVARDRDGALVSDTVALGKNGKGTATLHFAEQPGALHVAVGPAEASDEEMMGLQTLAFPVAARRWRGDDELRLAPVVIRPYYWYWWRRWCRTFTVRGRVVCPDGSPVPGATVCAFDVDRWLIWTSTQQVGCTTTNADGTFSLTFRWCCGWWPWWWWRLRLWRVDPDLLERFRGVVRQAPDLRLGRAENQPSLRLIEPLLADEPLATKRVLQPEDVSALPRLREQLVAALPPAPALERLRVWPWYPWYPWWDCTPDLLFKVTQDCGNGDQVILEETVADTRWNIPNPLDVQLVVSEDACCIPAPCPNPPCEGGECVILDQVCHYPVNEIGGNLNAPATPEGYANAGPVPPNSTGYHRPFAGVIPIYKNPGDLVNVDYYEVEYHDGASWNPLPLGAALDFRRQYWDVSDLQVKQASFPFTAISGHTVAETREHYEAGSGETWDAPGADNWWLSTNWNLLIPLDTRTFPDGTYRFRIVGWDESGGALSNRRVLPICGTDDENELVLTFDNRGTTVHDPSHNCGMGVHACTQEPDTHILSVRIDGEEIDPCGTAEYDAGATVEITFLAHDVDGHLSHYTLHSRWGLNQSRNLLQHATAVLGPQSGWNPGQTSGNYGTALAQGAVAPTWHGGTYTLRIRLEDAFPDPCCYQLDLRAWKRTVVGSPSGLLFTCSGQHHNRTEYTLGIGVCDPQEGVVQRLERDDLVLQRDQPEVNPTLLRRR